MHRKTWIIQFNGYEIIKLHYLKYIEKEKDRSQKTLENYRFYLSRFMEWAGDIAPSRITADKIQKYREWLGRLIDVHGETLKKNTQNYHLIALRNFLKYLNKQKVQTLNPSKIILERAPTRSISYIDGSDLNNLLSAPLNNIPDFSNVNNTGLIKLRDKAILELLFSTGLRVSELSLLKIKDINLKKENFAVGSDGRVRTVFLSEQARYSLKN
jgi:site-specific recombinase XerD